MLGPPPAPEPFKWFLSSESLYGEEALRAPAEVVFFEFSVHSVEQGQLFHPSLSGCTNYAKDISPSPSHIWCPAWRLRALVVHVSFTAEAFACSRRRALGLIIVWKYPPPCLPRLHTALSLVGVIRNLVISREVVQGTSPTNEVINQYIGVGGQGREDVIALESASKCSAD